jgi:hypothetical protein
MGALCCLVRTRLPSYGCIPGRTLLIMTDYYPALARAIGRLGTNVGEARRAIYEGARAALGRQLLGCDASDVTRHRLAFEEAVRKVEADCRVDRLRRPIQSL